MYWFGRKRVLCLLSRRDYISVLNECECLSVVFCRVSLYSYKYTSLQINPCL